MATSKCLVSIVTLLIVALAAPAATAQWVTFQDESVSRISASGALGLTDNREKDYAWGDIDKDGDIDLAVVRKQPFTSPGKNRNVLFINTNGVLVDRTGDFAAASSVSGDNGFLTPTNDRDVLLVDLDLDGWLDLVTATTISDGDPKYIGHPRIYMNLGCSVGGTAATSCTTENWNGLFYDEPRIPTMLSYNGSSGFNPRFCSVSTGDVNGDGYPDLYFGDYDSSGAGGSSQPPGADFNDKLLLNDGVSNPGFFTDVTADPGRWVGNVPGFSQKFNVSAFGAANAIIDMNGDGIDDIVKQTSLQSPTYVGIAYNDSTDELGYFDTYDVVNNLSPYFVSVGDLNNDGDMDLVITDDGADRYIINQGGGFEPNFVSFVFSYSHQGAGGSSGDDGFGGNSFIADLNKDGWNDVLITDVDVDIDGCVNRRMHIFKNLGGNVGGNVTLQEQTTGTGCQNFLNNPATCLVTSIPANKLLGVHDVAVFDLNGDTWDDLVVGRCSTTEVYMNVPPGLPAGGVDQTSEFTMLTMDRESNGDLTFNWGASCNLDDTDYSVYEGRLNFHFHSHAPLACSTGGATSATLTSEIENSTYYLIVPHNGTFEGSYGVDSNAVERGQGLLECRPTNVGSCD